MYISNSRLQAFSQNLSGKTIIIAEPYAVLMHHFSDLEKLPEKDIDPVSREHVQVLLEYIRPKFQQWCAPAKERLTQTVPTVTFKDIWFFMKPGSLAYAMRDDHWIGCIIEDTTKLGPDSLQGVPARWSINVWLLRVSEVSGEIRSASTSVIIGQYDGEKLVTSLPIFPREFHDREDGGARKDVFEKRGDKIRGMFWEGLRYMNYDGECLDHSRRNVSTYV